MSTEELLKPRYKVIADYPTYTGESRKYSHKKGDVIVFDTLDEVYLWKEQESDGTQCSKDHFDKYPAIFKKLEWWEERADEDMPEYVKVNPEKWDHSHGMTKRVTGYFGGGAPT